jgi:DNA-directed RNA polymerase beta subunit
MSSGEWYLSEMEKDCTISHGCSRILMDRLFLNSDKTEVPVCSKCGLIAISKSDSVECRNCKTISGIYRVQIPYACKLLIQELFAMSIVPRLRLEGT